MRWLMLSVVCLSLSLAEAAWDHGDEEQGDGGELLFTAWDMTRSYAMDLGLRYQAFQQGEDISAEFVLEDFPFKPGEAFQWRVVAGSKRKSLTYAGCYYPEKASREKCHPGAEYYNVDQRATGLLAGSSRTWVEPIPAANAIAVVDGVMAEFAANLNGGDRDMGRNLHRVAKIGDVDFFGAANWVQARYLGVLAGPSGERQQLWLFASSADGKALPPAPRGTVSVESSKKGKVLLRFQPAE